MIRRKRRPSMLARSALVGIALGASMATSSAHAGVEELKAAAKRPPREAPALLELGRSLRRAGLFDDALRVLRKGYAAAPKGETGIALRLEAARSLIGANKHKPAVAECRTLKALSPVKADVCHAEAQLLWKRASIALPSAEAALAKAPDDYDALVAKGRALSQMGNPGEAEAALRRAISRDGARFEAHLWLGELLRANGKQAEALKSLRTAARATAVEPEPHYELAQALGATAEAETELKKAIAIRPSYAAALALLGEVLLERKKVAEAEQPLKRAVALQPKSADYRAALARYWLDKGDADAALKESAAALKIVKNHGVAKLVEADALAKRGDIDLAIEAYERAYGMARTQPKALVHAARATLAAGRPTTARAFAERATQSFPSWAPAWEILGDVAQQNNDKKTARRAYERALKSKGPIDKPRVQQKLAKL